MTYYYQPMIILHSLMRMSSFSGIVRYHRAGIMSLYLVAEMYWLSHLTGFLCYLFGDEENRAHWCTA